MDTLLDKINGPLEAILEDGEQPVAAFVGSNFDVSALDGGSTRIVAVTGRGIAVVRTGLLRRLRPYAVESRRRFEEFDNPFFAWPGQTLYGEEFAQILSGIWVHRRWRQAVVRAYGVSVSLNH